jgi:hypothetical protein
VFWLEVLERAKERKKQTTTIHNTPSSIEDTEKDVSQNAVRNQVDKRAKRVGTAAKRKLEQASQLGLIVRWSYEFGYVSIHDPTTGEWHDLPMKDAPDWAKREAFKRKELRKHEGITRLLTAREMEGVWEKEQAPEPEGIVEDHPIEGED